jgi:MinD superfamily P-loop ATPase
MKTICLLSGKGGTGKTSIAASFYELSRNMVLVDADVESPNLHLIAAPQVLHKEIFFGRKKAHIDQGLCTACNICADLCVFEAIEKREENDFFIDPFLCEGCGLCVHVCPSSALSMVESPAGEWYVSKASNGPFIHGELLPHAEASGKMIRTLCAMAENLARQGGYEGILIDGPPGLGCPVISAVADADTVLLVTEPGEAGFYDLQRSLELIRHFGKKALVCINKSTINEAMTREIEQHCLSKKVEVIGKIPFDLSFQQAAEQGCAPITVCGVEMKEKIRALWEKIWGNP